MNHRKRLLTGCRINLSVSSSAESSDEIARVNWTIMRLVRAFVGQGAGVAFGHDWRTGGVMEAVYNFARDMRGFDGVDAPLVVNLLALEKGERSVLGESDLVRMYETLRVIDVGTPDVIVSIYRGDTLLNLDYPGAKAFARAMVLTYLRRFLNRISTARICIGGREQGYQGRYPGIVEEAFLAIDGGLPLYVSGILGGAAQTVIDALHGNPMPQNFAENENMCALFEKFAACKETLGGNAISDVSRDPAAIWRKFNELGIEGLSSLNGLTVDENEQFIKTTAVDTLCALGLQGIARVVKQRPELMNRSLDLRDKREFEGDADNGTGLATF